MSDVFISYSKNDRERVMLLSAYLESQGWSVWWDRLLGAGETYRDEIMKQLTSARAVIVLWTPASIKSDFVRAEAGRAKADGKLIPVMSEGIEYVDIPLPFGEMHTELESNKHLIKDAVISQLSKPFVEPTPARLILSTMQYQTLAWLGVVGGAVTLFAQFKNLIQLSDWASSIANTWHLFSERAWQVVGALVGIEFFSLITPVLSFGFFVICMGLGYRLRRWGDQDVSQSDSWLIRVATWFVGILLTSVLAFLVNLIVWPTQGAVYYLPVFMVPMLSVIAYAWVRDRRLLLRTQVVALLTAGSMVAALLYIYSLNSLIGGSGVGRISMGAIDNYLRPIAISLIIIPVLIVTWAASRRKDWTYFVLYFWLTIAMISLVAVPLDRIYYATHKAMRFEAQFELLIATVLAWPLPFVLLSLAPVHFVSKRLGVIISVVAALLLLNTVSTGVTEALKPPAAQTGKFSEPAIVVWRAKLQSPHTALQFP